MPSPTASAYATRPGPRRARGSQKSPPHPCPHKVPLPEHCEAAWCCRRPNTGCAPKPRIPRLTVHCPGLRRGTRIRLPNGLRLALQVLAAPLAHAGACQANSSPMQTVLAPRADPTASARPQRSRSLLLPPKPPAKPGASPTASARPQRSRSLLLPPTPHPALRKSHGHSVCLSPTNAASAAHTLLHTAHRPRASGMCCHTHTALWRRPLWALRPRLRQCVTR